MRFDPVAKQFEISVRDLADDEGFRRIGSGGEMWSRFGIGTDVHARVLQERRGRFPEYRSEVHLKVQIPVKEWTATVVGRLDGCLQDENGEWLIEEFKSCFMPEQGRFSGERQRHRRQLLIYCDLWRRLGNAVVNGALIYVDITTGRELVVPVRYDSALDAQEIQQRLERVLSNWQSNDIVRKKKAEVAANLPFPHHAPRPGQRKLIEAVQIAVRQNENLIAEAPTGSGKTAGGIHPALAEGLATGRQVVFLTSKTLQQKMAVNALTAMNTEGVFRTLQMRAKEKMCANGEVICHEDFCPYAKQYPEKMDRSKLLDRLRETQSHHDPDAVFAEAKREMVCPFEVQLELASRADAIVADYNYVFEPGIALKHLEEMDNAILIVDEAHNLPDRARQIFSPELREEMFRAALETTTGRLAVETRRATKKKKRGPIQENLMFDAADVAESGNLFDDLGTSLCALLSVLQKSAEILRPGETIAETSPPEEALGEVWTQWQPKFVRYVIWKRDAKLAAADDPIVEAHFTLQRFVTGMERYGPGFSCVVERENRGIRGAESEGIRLAIVCLDTAQPLAHTFRSAHATVLLSATLRPPETVRRVLGLQPNRTADISLPPPFPQENRKILVLPQVRTTFSERVKNFPRIAKLIAEMADAVPGNVLVLFPSYDFLSKIAEILPQTRARLLTQRANVPDIERQQILNTLTIPPPEGVLLFAVLGGMYAEGVDYPGELLSGVFVVSPALPQLSFERELLRRYFDENEGKGFEYAYLQPGMTRVIQAAGRLIRNETDRGVIALICQRFLQEPYVSHMPADWFNESPLELVAANPVDEIKKFFS